MGRQIVAFETAWGTEETVRQRMTCLLGDALAEVENYNLSAAAMNATAALEAWREAGEPDYEGPDGEQS